MTNSKFYIAFLFLFIVSSVVIGQEAYKVHAHNDYHHDLPFWFSYNTGAASIEVDLYLQDDTLFVTHAKREIISHRTFDNLYLDAINKLSVAGALRPLQLLIDIKSEPYSSLDQVMASVKNYPVLLKDPNIKFVISGERPKIEDYSNYPDFILFDHQNLNDLEKLDLDKVGMISRSFKRYSTWNGYGRMTERDLYKVNLVIEKAHSVDKPFRFWATPDTKTAWSAFAELGLDYINSDKPDLAGIFLSKLESYTYAEDKKQDVYQPLYQLDEDAKPKNIILLIGDGNGLSQITAAMVANRGELTLTNIKDIGLVKTASADDLITDSAGAGTAIATGVKANNRAIGVDPEGKPRKTIIEILSEHNYNTGIITTDAIYGATPSSFYAHTAERDDEDVIMEDLKKSELDLFIAAGKVKEEVLKDKFRTQTLEEFNNIDQPTAIYNGDHKMPSMTNGRGDYVVRSTSKALEVLNKEDQPFLLVIEGAQIDNGGHANDISTIITEMLDFDQVIAEALKFADANQNTLVIITADHETGGLGIAGGDLKTGTVRADFLSVDHSGVMVPLFAYGPQSRRFTGVMDNTDIFHRVFLVLGIEGNK